MLGEKIEFYGEQLSILAISKKIGITRDTLKKYYEQTGSIYEAEKICRTILTKKEASLVEYEEERLAIETIAKKVGIKDAKTLKKYYELTGDIYQAIERCNEGKIEYDGEKMTLDAIARREDIKRDTLERRYNKTGDIYEAVKYCIEAKKKAEDEKIDYKDEKRTKTSVARELGIDKKTFAKYYEQAKTVEGAVELYRASLQTIEDAKVLYNGELKSVKAIARDEDVAETTLTRYLQRYQTIEKAVFMAKIQRQKTKTVKVKNRDMNLYDLSIILGIKYTELMNMLNKGMSIEQVKEQNKTHSKKVKIKQEYINLSNGQTLLEYCVDNGLNYAFIYRAINTYGKTLEEAVTEYKTTGSKLPSHWIFEKYGLLLRHLMTKNNIDIQRVVDYMRKEQISMNEAMEKYIIRRNSKKEGLDADWMQEVYAVLIDDNMTDEYDDFKKAFYIDEKEEECVIESYDEVQNLERILLLFEIAEAIRESAFSQEEMPELLQIYEVKPKEIETIFLDLYGKYEGKIALGENEPQVKRRSVINEITRKWYYLTAEERDRVLADNEISTEEERTMTELSSNIVKYKNMLRTVKKERTIGEE